MITVTGNPRSGTSLTMLLFATAVGEDRILGDKFPQLDRSKKKKDIPNEIEEIVEYIKDKYEDKKEDELKKSIDMNPNGFWECPFTVHGISWGPVDKIKELIKKIKEEEYYNKYIMKIVNSGLLRSDPEYIGKVVYLVRHPYDIAKSQIRLKRSQKFTIGKKEVDLYNDVIVNDPLFYIQSTIQFAKWRVDNPGKEVLFVGYDELISDPENTLKKMADFTGIKNLIDSKKVINKKLQRSKTEHKFIPGIWEDAVKIHEMLLDENFQGIIDYSKRKDTWLYKRTATWVCLRIRSATSYMNCYDCYHKRDKDFIKTGIERAEANEWDWENEPCAFECGFDCERESPISIEDSIKNNHWI